MNDLNKNLIPLLHTELKIGMIVIDNDGDIGVITECEDPHNILVEYENGGKGLHCLVDNCKEYSDKLYKY